MDAPPPPLLTRQMVTPKSVSGGQLLYTSYKCSSSYTQHTPNVARISEKKSLRKSVSPLIKGSGP